MDFGGGEEIRFERIGKAGVVTLTRPKALNALSHGMIRALTKALSAWEQDPDIALVVLKGEGRAFCAGGDIRDAYEKGRRGEPPVEFFWDEYRLNFAISAFSKPYVSLIDGIVMGGGIGITCHGSCRVMTENALIAMPEVGIGFFPDVGGSHLLPRLKGSFGIYLGLTGNRIRYGDALWSGLATHVVRSDSLPELFAALTEEGKPEAVLPAFCEEPPRETDDAVVHAIQHHFSRETLDAVLESLRQAAAAREKFAAGTLEIIKTRSPTSLHVTFCQLESGAMLAMDECMKMEFRIVNRMLQGHDFYEGVRALLVDKDNRPQWRPGSVDEVEPDAVKAYFAPLDRELEL